jgi:hypothetical protein
MPFKKFERPVDIAIFYSVQDRPARVWVDSNFDKVFAPNEELEAVKFGKRTVFGPLRSRGRDGDPVCYVEDGINIVFIPTGWRQGEFVAGGVKNVIAAFDTDHDGEFKGGDDFFGQSDHLVVGELRGEAGLRYYRDRWPPGESDVRQLLDGSFWDVSISLDGKKANFKQLPTLGTLEVSGGSAQVFGHSRPPNCITTYGSPLPMPVGTYAWVQVNATLIGKDGLKWKVEYFDGHGAPYSIRLGVTTRIEVGPPVKAESKVEGADYGGVDYVVNYFADLLDAYGHTITRVVGPDGKVVVPKLVITNKRGKVVESPDWIDTTTISYGGGYGKKEAPLTFTITWDFGALGKVRAVDVLK